MGEVGIDKQRTLGQRISLYDSVVVDLCHIHPNNPWSYNTKRNPNINCGLGDYGVSVYIY